jgi:hypothetical protein
MFPQYCSTNHEYWYEDSASADDVDYFLDEALSQETEEDEYFSGSDCGFPAFTDNAVYTDRYTNFLAFDEEVVQQPVHRSEEMVRCAPALTANPFYCPEGDFMPRSNVKVESVYQTNTNGSAGIPLVAPLSPPPPPMTSVFLKPGEFLVPPKPAHLNSMKRKEAPEQNLDAQYYPKRNGFMDESRKAVASLPLPDFKYNLPTSDVLSAPIPNDSNSASAGNKKKPSFPRKHFRETVGAQICRDLMSEKYSYEEIITKYSALYPEYASKFTPSFCSKVRCGRIMNTETQKIVGIPKPKSRIKRVSKLSHRR